MKRVPAVVGALLSASLLLAHAGSAQVALDRYDLAKPSSRFELPRGLREISGLAVTKDGRLFGHDDETGTLHEIDPRTGRVVKSFSLGERKPVKGDFEGLAIVEDRFYLTTSDGDVFVGREGRDGAGVPYDLVRTGLGEGCEIEGLASEPSTGTLLFACKTARAPEVGKTVTVFRWSLATGRLASPPMIQVPRPELTPGSRDRHFHPSDLARDPVTGHLVLVAAKEGGLLEITAAGTVVAVRRLDPARHRQAEGIAFLPDGTLAVADEGGTRNGTLTLYRRRP